MQKISSSTTFFVKKILPLLWFCFPLAGLTWAFVQGETRGLYMWLFVAFFFVAVGLAVWWTLIRDLADEVYDCGDNLLVRFGGKEERVPLRDVMHVDPLLVISPPRVTLRLVEPGRFGEEIAFSPKNNPFEALVQNPLKRRNPVSEDLIVRVDRARRSLPRD